MCPAADDLEHGYGVRADNSEDQGVLGKFSVFGIKRAASEPRCGDAQ